MYYHGYLYKYVDLYRNLINAYFIACILNNELRVGCTSLCKKPCMCSSICKLFTLVVYLNAVMYIVSSGVVTVCISVQTVSVYSNLVQYGEYSISLYLLPYGTVYNHWTGLDYWTL